MCAILSRQEAVWATALFSRKRNRFLTGLLPNQKTTKTRSHEATKTHEEKRMPLFFGSKAISHLFLRGLRRFVTSG
jgi:hypothetical protein